MSMKYLINECKNTPKSDRMVRSEMIRERVPRMACVRKRAAVMIMLMTKVRRKQMVRRSLEAMWRRRVVVRVGFLRFGLDAE